MRNPDPRSHRAAKALARPLVALHRRTGVEPSHRPFGRVWPSWLDIATNAGAVSRTGPGERGQVVRQVCPSGWSTRVNAP